MTQRKERNFKQEVKFWLTSCMMSNLVVSTILLVKRILHHLIISIALHQGIQIYMDSRSIIPTPCSHESRMVAIGFINLVSSQFLPVIESLSRIKSNISVVSSSAVGWCSVVCSILHCSKSLHVILRSVKLRYLTVWDYAGETYYYYEWA